MTDLTTVNSSCNASLELERGINKGVFERRMSTGSEVFFILEFLDDTKFVLLSFFTLVEAICSNIWANKLPRNEKNSPPPAGRGSLKTFN